MNYDCPVCGRPQLCGRLYQESFFFGSKLVDYEFNQTCRGCKSSWTSIARVGKKNKHCYDHMDFQNVIIHDEWKKISKTWQETVQEQTLK